MQREKMVQEALLKAESRGGSLIHLPTLGDPTWVCYREHKWVCTYKQILDGMWCEECNESLGEMAIRCHLEYRKIEYRSEVSFPSLCIHGQLRFDFYLPKYRLVIEGDGEQHFGRSKFKVKMLEILERDEFKDVWCQENGFSILRIPYWQIAETETLIDSAISETEKGRVYKFDHRDWRQTAIKSLKGKKKMPKSPAPRSAKEITKEGRDERRKQRDDERESIQLKLAMPLDFELEPRDTKVMSLNLGAKSTDLNGNSSKGKEEKSRK